jgi:hypothetical protein
MGGVHNNKTCIVQCNKSSSRNLLCKIGIHGTKDVIIQDLTSVKENCNADI